MDLNSFNADRQPPQASMGGLAQQRSGQSADDIAVVDRVLAGDTQAFAAIVQRWQGPLINMAWRYCRDRGLAEEMAQEAFVRAWRGLRQWRREGSFSTWLFSVAANVYRTELKRIPSPELSLNDVAELSGPFVHDVQLDGDARDEAVRRAVLALPEKYREPQILFYFVEMDLAAAAATMGLPEGTMKARLSRGRALLRQRFPQLREQLPEMPDEGHEGDAGQASGQGPPFINRITGHGSSMEPTKGGGR
jgi:RNA polymerase sigma factor (sigma-70 family)